MKKLLTMIGAAAVVAVGTAFDAIATELVTNGSFETYTGTISQNSGKWQYLGDGISFDGWTTASGVGITTAADTTWKASGLVRGNYTCFLQNIGSLTNMLNATEAGTYQISFVYAARSASYKNGIIHIEIDGTEVGQVNCGSSQIYRFALMETELSVGNHVLTIRHDNSQQNNACSTIDAVSIKPKSTRIVCNGGFEDYTGSFPVGSNKYFAGYNSASCYAYGWETSDGYGLSAAGSPYLSGAGGSPFEGYTALHFNGLKEINQNVVIPEDGVYEISFAYAPRDKTNYAGGRVNVWIDDEKVGYADSDPITTKFRRCRVRTQIAAGTHVFKLSHTLDHPVASNTPCTAVDDVSIVKVDDGNLIANGGFENYIGTLSGIQSGFSDSFLLDGWKYETSGEGLATTNSNYLAETKGSPFEGNVSLYFNSGSSHLEHSVSQTVYVAESGDYEMSFVYAPRDNTYYYGGRIWVLVDGEEVGEYADCDNSTTAFRRHAFRMPLSSGLHVIELKHGEGESIGGNYACSAIDDVALKAVDAMLMNGSFDLGTVAANGGVHSSHTVAGYSNPGWNCSGNVGLSKPDAAHVPSTLDVGTYALYMQTANYLDGSTLRESDDAYAWQSFSVATAGCYSVSFHYAKRANPYVNKMANVRVRRGVGTDGDIVFDKQFTASNSSSFDDFTGKVTLREPGTYTLEFFVPKPDYATSRNDGSVIIDDVSINWYSNIMGLIISVF